MSKENTVTQRIISRAEVSGHVDLDTISVKLVGLVILLTGVGMIVFHQLKHDDAPELYILVPSLLFTTIGLAMFSPKSLNIVRATIVEVVPFLGKKTSTPPNS